MLSHQAGEPFVLAIEEVVIGLREVDTEGRTCLPKSNSISGFVGCGPTRPAL